MRTQPRRIGISIGDPNGIGPEVMLKALADERILEKVAAVVYTPPKVITYYQRLLGLESVRYRQIARVEEASTGVLNLLPTAMEIQEAFNVSPGQADVVAGRIAVASIMAAAADLEAGKIEGVVTNPINKFTTHSTDFPYAGHTDFFAGRFALLKDKSVMILTAPGCTVAPITVHLPLKEVAAALSKELVIEKAMMLELTLKRDFAVQKPRIGVMALNPHAGDNGLLGTEEEEIIAPAIEELFKEHKIDAFGPFSPDAYWGSGMYKQFHATLSMYHDQGLIPFKLLCMERGVNYTAGLRIVRCSPDHGTAFDIAGKGEADETSFREALYLCLDVCQNRSRFDEALRNPLRKTFYNNEKDTGIEDLPPVEEEE